MKGKLIIFAAPSGSGKSTIINWLMQEHPELKDQIKFELEMDNG